MRNYFKKLALLSVFVAFSSAHAGSFEDFFRDVRSDNASGIAGLLNRGFDPNTRDAQGQTGLLIAVKEPSLKVVKVLLDSPQTDVEARNAKDESPLMLAALKGLQDVVARLIERDADINKTGWAPLHYAASSGQVAIMKLLLDKSAFIDAESPNGTTPLMMAAMYGTTDAVKLLLDEGADPFMKNQLGMTAADFAQKAARPDAVALIGAAIRAKKPSDGKW